MLMTETRLRTLIRALLEEVTPPVAQGTNPMDTGTTKTAAEIDAARRAEGLKGDFDDDLADLLAKKMKDKGASETSINDMKRTVQDGR